MPRRPAACRGHPEVKQEVHFCSRCFNYATADECSICQDPMRDTTRICVVGEPRDVQCD